MTRFAAVNYPFSSLKLTSKFTIGCLGLTWLYSSMNELYNIRNGIIEFFNLIALAIWITPPLFGWNRFILEGCLTSCTFDYIASDWKSRSFIWLLITGGFFLPLTVIVLCYILIVVKLSKRRSTGFQGLNDNNDDSDHHTPNTVAQSFRRTEIRATRNVVFIVIMFCLAWGPYALMALLVQFGLRNWVNAYNTSILGIFTKTAACTNPMIYALSLTSFRDEFISLWNNIRHHNSRKLTLNLKKWSSSIYVDQDPQHRICSEYLLKVQPSHKLTINEDF
ncbi:unnamed protein product [Didymodactylos carnosus]|uniref:G-protein coupled receptors family 1 profile domain-containing protein n=1 Tax=Didymodactylos carnosus TaxID=1234261 RepID=A0A814DHE7_9BILA|nr:unnamed protein product [Didymodactylos carnosus]CAF1494217.1 unnamed protein product [Didymodactylos carnosus]CAF3733286.1 unnamed protein product [Didymodactylos carnosus]CAF4283215.1 unnamed protein product [Didymodactylos carnosus]